MAESRQSTAQAYKQIIADLKSKNFSPLYLLMGTESYYIDKVCEAVTTYGLTEEEKDFNQTTYYGPDVTVMQVIDQARRYPMMADRQIVVVREAQALKDFEALEKYFDHPVPSTILVICYNGTMDGRKKANSKMLTQAAKVGTVLTSTALQFDSEISAFIQDYLKEPEHKASIDPQTALLIAAHIGGDIKRITSELDKLLMDFAPGAPRKITADQVERRIGISKEYNVFEMRDALINRDAVKAQRIAKYFNSNPKAGGLYSLLPFLFSFFQNLMLCYYAPKPINESAIVAQLGLARPKQAYMYLRAMKSFNARHTLDIITKIRETDARSKGLDNANTPPAELLQELISFILL